MGFKEFIKKENLTLKNIFNPVFMFHFLYKHNYIQFFIVGASGALIALLLSFILTEFILGQEQYLLSYLIVLILNLIYNFVMYLYKVFRAHTYVWRRFAAYAIYFCITAYINYLLVGFLTPVIGETWYLFVQAGVILVSSVVNYFACKFFIFLK